MNTVDTLFIRAIKSDNSPRKRLESIHRRFFMCHCAGERSTNHILHILANIVDKHNPIPLSKVLEPAWYEKADTYEDTLINVLVNHIRFTEGKNLPGYRPPLAFRKRWGDA